LLGVTKAHWELPIPSGQRRSARVPYAEVSPKPPTQDQKGFGAENYSAERDGIRKVLPDRSNQSGDAERYGHKKTEGSAHAGAQTYILMATQHEHTRCQQLAPHRLPSRSD